MNQEHILSLVSDYTLDLLSPIERQHIEAHAAACDTCRRALQREKQLTLAIGHTLHLAAQPGTGRLQALMPSPPRPVIHPQRATIPPPGRRRTTWASQLAPVTLVLVLLVGSLWVYLNGPSDPWRNPVPGYIVATEMAATATATATAISSATSSPTSSPVATLAEGEGTTFGQTAEPTTTDSGRPETPATPIAKVMVRNGTN